MTDIKMIHKDGYGDFAIENGDLIASNGLFETVYVALYGSEIRLGRWFADRDLQNPQETTEGFYQKILQRININNFSKDSIINAINTDLQFLLDNNVAKTIETKVIENYNTFTINLNIDGVLLSFREKLK